MHKKAFTLIEMLSVVAIIAILCGIIFGASGAIHSRNAEIKTRSMLKQVEIALNECKQKFGYYPQSTSSAFAEMQKGWFWVDDDAPAGADTVAKKYSREFKKSCNFTSFEIEDGKICDAWGEPLRYKSDGKSFYIYSVGRDGEYEDNNEDDAKNEDNVYLD